MKNFRLNYYKKASKWEMVKINLIALILFNNLLLSGQEFPVPFNYNMIGSATGDLDNDGIDMLII